MFLEIVHSERYDPSNDIVVGTLILTPRNRKQIATIMIISVSGLNGTGGGCGVANDLTGAKAVDAMLFVRLVTDTFIIFCNE